MSSMRFMAGLAAALLALAVAVHGRPFMVVAYNVENLFDLDGAAAYEDYRPGRYTPAHALTKLRNIARVVTKFEGGRGPDVLLLNELEVDATPGRARPDHQALLARFAGRNLSDMLGRDFGPDVADLPAEFLLLKALAEAGASGYRVVVAEEEGADRQQVTCAVFTRFPVKRSRSHATPGGRPILEVQVEVDGAPLYLFANHWKSGASDPATEPQRVASARTLRTRIDTILRGDPNADIIVGGDFNSQYNQRQRHPEMRETAMNDVLGSQGNELAVRQPERPLYNLWFELPPGERGSDVYRGEWGTLIHLLITRGLYDFRGVQYVDNSFTVGKFPGLNADGRGQPVRWSFDGTSGAGFSDHFPVAAKFITVNNGRTDHYLALRNPSEDRVVPVAPRKVERSREDPARTALRPEQLTPGTDIRQERFKGKIFQVEGRVVPGERLAVEFRGEVFDVWSHDEALRRRLRAEYPAGRTMRFHGELGQYRGRWQFVIHEPGWLR